MNNLKSTQNILLDQPLRNQLQNYYNLLHAIGSHRRIHVKLSNASQPSIPGTFTDSLEKIFQSLNHNHLLPQIKSSLEIEINHHDGLWWPVRLFRRFITHRDIENKRDLFHYICAKESLDEFSKSEDRFTFKEVTVMPKNLIDEIVDFFNIGKGVKSIRQSLDSLMDQVEQSPLGSTKKIKKLFSEEDSEFELEIPKRSQLEKFYREAIRLLTEFKYESLGEMDFQKNIDKIKLGYETQCQNLIATDLDFDNKNKELYAEYMRLISNKAFHVRRIYDEYAEEKWEKDKLYIKNESDRVINEVKDACLEGLIDSCQKLVDFYHNKKSIYLKDIIQPIQEFYKDGMNDLAASAYCIRQEQYIEGEIIKIKQTFTSSAENIQTTVISNNNNKGVDLEAINQEQPEEPLTELNKKYSQQKQELQTIFDAIKKNFLNIGSAQQFAQHKQTAKNQIKQYYKEKMVLIFHPDKNPTLTNEAQEKFTFFSQKIEEVTNVLDQITYENLDAFKHTIQDFQVESDNGNKVITNYFSELFGRMYGLSVTMHDVLELRQDIQRVEKDQERIENQMDELIIFYKNAREYSEKNKTIFIDELSRCDYEIEKIRKVEIKKREDILREHMKTWNDSPHTTNKPLKNAQRTFISSRKSMSFPMFVLAGLVSDASVTQSHYVSDSYSYKHTAALGRIYQS